MLFANTLNEVFQNNKIIAIIGANDVLGRPVEHVGRYLLEQGYTVLPVHPARKSAWGIDTYKSILDLPDAPDIVCLFRASNACVMHAQEIVDAIDEKWDGRKPNIFWMQTGIFSEEAGTLMQKHGIQVVEDLCMEVEHKRLHNAL